MSLGRVFVLFLFLCLLFSNCNVSKFILTKKYSPEELKEDTRIAAKVILAMHPTIGIYKPKSFYEKLFSDFENSLGDCLTEKEYRLKLKLISNQLLCGHTEVINSKANMKAQSRMKQNFSPYIFLPVKDKVYFLGCIAGKQDSAIKKGDEVSKINGIPCDSMLRHIRKYISADGYNTTSKIHYVTLGFNSFYPSLFGRPDTFQIEFSHKNEIKKIKYASVKLKYLPPLPLSGKEDSLFVKFRRAGLRYKFLDSNKKNLLLKLERFSNVGYIKAYRKIFRRMKKSKTENLILDLRNNGGGSLTNTYKLLSYLIDSARTMTLRTTIKNYPYKKYTRGNIAFQLTKLYFRIYGRRTSTHDTDYFSYSIKPTSKNHFDGKVIVLINGGSFSASALVSAYLEYKNRAQFIGEETGGAIEGCNAGITPYYILPNTKVSLRIPAFRIIHDVNPKITGHGIKPDHETDYKVKDLFSKRDLDLIKAKEILKIQ